METQEALGVDIGNVIINNRLLDPEIKSVDEETYAAFPSTEGVFDVLKILNNKFNGNVFLISKNSGKIGILTELI